MVKIRLINQIYVDQEQIRLEENNLESKQESFIHQQSPDCHIATPHTSDVTQNGNDQHNYKPYNGSGRPIYCKLAELNGIVSLTKLIPLNRKIPLLFTVWTLSIYQGVQRLLQLISTVITNYNKTLSDFSSQLRGPIITFIWKHVTRFGGRLTITSRIFWVFWTPLPFVTVFPIGYL